MLFRSRDWLSDLDWAHKAIADLEQKARGSFPNDIQYLKGLQDAQRDIRDFENSLGRAIRAIFFDIPMQTIFAAGYARTAEEADDKTGVFFKEVSLKGQTRIMQIAREIGPFSKLFGRSHTVSVVHRYEFGTIVFRGSCSRGRCP